MRKISILLVLIFSLVVCVYPAIAKEKAPLTEQELQARLEQINDIVGKKIKDKASPDEIAVELEKFGLKRLNGKKQAKEIDGEIGTLSNPDYCIDLPQAGAFWDSYAQKYYVYAYFFWNSEAQWRADCPTGTYSSANVGGNDSFGIAFSKAINRYSQQFQTWDNNGIRQTNTSTATKANSYGVAFSRQDKALNSGDIYTWDSGMIGLYMLPQSTGYMTFWQEMAHTWSSTGVSAVSIGPGGITFTFTSSNNKWEAVAPVAGEYTFNQT